ncbi:hypothetical protein [Sutcliffiella sp. NC1]|uniref:hypothetical protein n=1 Tax=Sutcliffiella sp. NC1 TaxID=3004096 RepID=UPI0022DDB24C|nr:hypothetical protein [Sutcliffiella sp. NC1]WBL15231.1 hypothetical protein O1A01_00645 [Sutcliffiella sp. NC1]
MNDIHNILEKSRLPIQLKDYFSESKKIQKLLTEKLIHDIEDLYLYYDSLYYFELTEFGVRVIDSLIRCKDFTTYYFYLKKILDNHLEVEWKNKNNSIIISTDYITELFKKSASEIIELLSIDSDEKLDHLNYQLGKLELINELIDDDDFIEFYEKIIQLKDDYYYHKKDQQ